MFVDFGCTVTLVEQLPQMDRDLGDALAFSLKQRGVKVMTGSSVDRIDSEEKRLQRGYKDIIRSNLNRYRTGPFRRRTIAERRRP